MRIPKPAPSLEKMWSSAKKDDIHKLVKIMSVSKPTVGGKYLHWDDIRYRSPPEEGITTEEWWHGIKMARGQIARRVEPMSKAYASKFSFSQTDQVQRMLHRFDRGNVSETLLRSLGNESAVVEYRVRQLIEEAISSSEIEGARPTTREVARQLVREKRKPVSKDEHMVLNNWLAMKRIVEMRTSQEEMTLDELLELHRILGENALDVEDGAGAFREQHHDVRVEDQEGNVWHIPPPAVDPDGRLPELGERMRALLAFANDTTEGEGFVHPILRAIICHFWLGYEHPFRDGNGRMARALFYWVMLKNGYEMAEFLSISGPIDRALTQYYRAFALVETDAGDLTYFILNQLEVMSRALKELRDHLQERSERTLKLSKVVQGFDQLNHRQRSLLQHAVKHRLESYTFNGHAQSHKVSYHTARTDLLGLVKSGYFTETKVGNKKRFKPKSRLVKLLEQKRNRNAVG